MGRSAPLGDRRIVATLRDTPRAHARARGAWRVVRLRRGARASRLRRGRQAQARLAADRPRGGHRHSARPAPREAGEKRRLQHLAWDYDAKADPYGDDDYVSARARRRRGRRGVIVYVRASAAAPRPPPNMNRRTADA